jgi:hypothetical protein
MAAAYGPAGRRAAQRHRCRLGTRLAAPLIRTGPQPYAGGMSAEAVAPRACRTQDLSALIGLLAVIEGELMTDEAPQHLSGRLRRRLESAGLLEPGAGERDLRQAINDLNHRLRYAAGEYADPPSTLAVPE